MKYLILVFILMTGCDSKKSKLDTLYKQKTELQYEIDSAKKYYYSLEEPKTIEDTAGWGKRRRAAFRIDALSEKMKKIDFSIDSMAKY